MQSIAGDLAAVEVDYRDRLGFSGPSLAAEGQPARRIRVRGATPSIRLLRASPARVLRETAIVDDGVVLTGKLGHGLLPHDAAGTDVKRAPRPARAGVRFGRGPGHVPLWGGAAFADVIRAAL
jgi:hypothetical protein